MAVIQSGAGATNLTIDTSSNAARVTIYSSSGTEFATSTNPVFVQSGSTGSATPTKAVLVAGDDGTNLKGLITASAANMVSAGQLGDQTLTMTQMGQWAVTHLPATATKATISKGANASGRHVCTGYISSMAVAGTTCTTVLTWSIRDGATGAGTVLWSGAMQQFVTGQDHNNSQNGLALIGTANTAMTIEFSAAGTTATQQTVSMQGFDTE